MTDPTTSTLWDDVTGVVRHAVSVFTVRHAEGDPDLVIVGFTDGFDLRLAQAALIHAGYALARRDGLNLHVRRQDDKAGRLRDALDDAFRFLDVADFETDLTKAAREELVHVWHDLYEHRKRAVNGVWSSGCEATVYRIVLLSRLVGATSWRDVQTALIVDGVYQGLYERAGITYDPIDMDKVRKLHEQHNQHGVRLL